MIKEAIINVSTFCHSREAWRVRDDTRDLVQDTVLFVSSS